MDPRAVDHCVFAHERSPDTLMIARPEDCPVPTPPSVMVEIRAAFILRQPDEWVIVLACDGGVRVGRGQIHTYTQKKVEGLS